LITITDAELDRRRGTVGMIRENPGPDGGKADALISDAPEPLLRDADGTPTHGLGVGRRHYRSARSRSEENVKLLLRELNHSAKTG